MSIHAAFPLRRLGPAGSGNLDADTAWLRAAVECFEPRLRELDHRRAPATPAAWSELPGLGCGWSCRCCREPFAAPAALELDRLSGRAVSLADRETGDAWRRSAAGRGATSWAVRRGSTRKLDLMGPLGRGSVAGALDARLARAAAAGRLVVLGTLRDPYAGDAADRARTRALLTACRAVPALHVAVVTASPLVLCDRDLLLEIDAAGSATVEIGLPTTDAVLARRLEPSAPSAGERLAAAAELAAEGLAVHLRLRPLLPGVGDEASALAPFFAAAGDAGARDVAASPLVLDRGTRQTLLPWLSSYHPGLLALYRDLYPHRAHLRPAHRTATLADFHRLRLAHGYPRATPGRT